MPSVMKKDWATLVCRVVLFVDSGVETFESGQAGTDLSLWMKFLYKQLSKQFFSVVLNSSQFWSVSSQ